MTQTVHPVILCGGSGTRLWPLSTPEQPKQFLALTSSKSMIKETAERFNTPHEVTLSFSPPLIVGSKQHEGLLDETLPGSRKILEPFGRNSAPAIAAACLLYDAEDLILILPADHSIKDVPAFHRAIAAATAPARNGAIVTFGIIPNHPATGYGYIKAAKDGALDNPVAVEEFVEKPKLDVAKMYLAAGSYYWNAGIFLFKAGAMLEALEANAPHVLAGVRTALTSTSEQTLNLDPKSFAETPSISIDYAVMEKARNVQTVPVKMGWNDVGGYPALHELLTGNATENYVSGPVLVQDSEGLYVRSEGPYVSVSGLKDLVIVATGDEVMVTPMSDAAAVKSLGSMVQKKRYALGFSEDLIDETRAWLFNAFDVWAEKAWDHEHGGFVEQLSMDGVADTQSNRRVRVQARQVFSFSKAITLGWPNVDAALRIVEQGVTYMDTRLRHPDRGWVHIVKPDGTPLDERRDLYDHAFIILAGSAVYQATGNESAIKLADDAIACIDAEMKDPAHGGWYEAVPAALPRRANPHMHLLEAMLAYHAATACKKALERASEIVRLFETRFFNPATDILTEFFTEDWRLVTCEQKTVFEPGHHYEWATLLLKYERLTGHDTLSWRRRLIRKADHSGRDVITGFAVNALQADGIVINNRRRLWHQLEMFRANRMHPAISGIAANEALLRAILKTYLNAGPDGGWLDETDAAGQPYSNAVPASMLYHMVTAFEPIL